MGLRKIEPVNVEITKRFTCVAGDTPMYLCCITARVKVDSSKRISKYMVEPNTKCFDDCLEFNWGKYVDGYRESSIYLYSSNLEELRYRAHSRVKTELDVLRKIVAINREQILGCTIFDVEEETYEL
ncbi:MAG: hypothetical protein ACTSR2_09420 [Candidatus Hodarchaeales archaeon]